MGTTIEELKLKTRLVDAVEHFFREPVLSLEEVSGGYKLMTVHASIIIDAQYVKEKLDGKGHMQSSHPSGSSN